MPKQQKPIAVSPDLVVPHRIVRVGAPSTDPDAPVEPVPPDTVADPVGRRAIAKANEDVRDLPRRERIIKVGAPGERNRGLAQAGNKTNKVPSMVPDAIGDVYPGEHRYAYQLEAGDRFLVLSDPTPQTGRWIKVNQVHITRLDGAMVNAEIHGTSETGWQLVLGMQPNAQLRLVTNQEEP